MPRKIFVIGHKNPDTDSIVSALAYTELLHLQGEENVIAARQGEVWHETRFILDRFGQPLPALVEDVHPHARDVMTTDPIVGSPDESAYRVGRRLREHRIRAMPLLDVHRRWRALAKRSLPWPRTCQAEAPVRFSPPISEFRIDDTSFAVGYMETVHKRRVDEIRDGLLAEMKAIRADKGYAALLFMVVDVVHSQTEILITSMEEEVAEDLGQRLASPHSVMIGGVMSRKKQVVPILPRIARQRKISS
jgi:inorganic pyrophosphatase/exopolyphosphatase